MKTSELTDSALDYAVHVAKGNSIASCEYWREKYADDGRRDLCERYSTEWSQGGPIIEREKIYLNCLRKGDHYRTEIWEAWPYDSAKLVQQGPTPLIAAMRCYCASKLGDEVGIPEIWHKSVCLHQLR